MIDKSKTYKTRDGKEVEIYRTDAGGEYPILGAIKRDDIWCHMSWNSNGLVYKDSHFPLDLIEVREAKDFWINESNYLLGGTLFTAHESQEEADAEVKVSRRVRCIHVREVI